MKTLPPSPQELPHNIPFSESMESALSPLGDARDNILSFSDSIITSSQNTIQEIGAMIPSILQGIAVFALGWMFGIFIEWLFIKMGEKLRLSYVWKKTGFADLLKKADIHSSPSKLVGAFLKITIIMFFLRQSMKIMGFVEVEEFLGDVINLIPDIIIAVVILLFAISVADTASSVIKNLLGFGDENARKIIALVTKNILIAFGIMAVLVQLHIAEELVQTLFTALVAMLALAGGLAFGLGGKDFVRDMIEEVRKKEKKSPKKSPKK